MTTRVGGTSSGGRGELVPALGESWAHCPTVRVVCRWVDNVRTAKVIKAPHLANKEAAFQVRKLTSSKIEFFRFWGDDED